MIHILKLTQKDLDILNLSLQEMPYKMAAPLINKINIQIKEQNITNEQSES